MGAFRCDVCGKSFSYFGNLKRHTNWIHEKRGEICTVCLETFRGKSELRNHMRLAHDLSESNQFNLNNDKENNLLNKNSHRTAKHHLYACEFCDKTFSDIAALKRHKLLVHQKHFCKVCSASFDNEEDLANHLSLHRKTIISKQIIKRHVRPLFLQEDPENIEQARGLWIDARNHDIIKNNWHFVRTHFHIGKIQNRYNIRLPNQSETRDVMFMKRMAENIFNSLKTQAKWNASFGVILENNQTQELRYFYR